MLLPHETSLQPSPAPLGTTQVPFWLVASKGGGQPKNPSPHCDSTAGPPEGSKVEPGLGAQLLPCPGLPQYRRQPALRTSLPQKAQAEEHLLPESPRPPATHSSPDGEPCLGPGAKGSVMRLSSQWTGQGPWDLTSLASTGSGRRPRSQGRGDQDKDAVYRRVGIQR